MNLFQKYTIELKKTVKCNALQLEGRRRSRQSFWAVFAQIFTASAQKLLLLTFRSKLWYHY